MDIQRDKKIKSSYRNIVTTAKLGNFVFTGLNMALARADNSVYMLTAASAGAAPSKLQDILGNIAQLFPGIVLVALIGFIGVIFRGKTDRGISNEQNNIKIFENVIKDNDALRTKNGKLESEMNTSFRENSTQANRIANLESKLESITNEIVKLKEDNTTAQKIIVEKEKLLTQLKGTRLKDRLRDLGITQAQLDEIIEKGERNE